MRGIIISPEPPERGYITRVVRRGAPANKAAPSKEENMVLILCDLCRKEIKQGYTAKVEKSRDHIEYETTGVQLDICPECFEKIQKGSWQTAEKKIRTPMRAKEEKKPAEKTPEKEPKREEKQKIDRDKIWALRHAKQPWSYEEIAQEMGCSPLTVAEYIRQMKKERGEE